MTDTEIKRRKAICEAAHVDEIDDVSDGFHTFRQLYYQRMMLFAAIVKQNKDKAWKSLRHEDGELCFGGGWFIVGIDTPEGSFTYHYEDNYFSLFDCEELECGKHWDGHTEKDVTRLLSLSPTQPEPCEDAVSRKAAIDAINNIMPTKEGFYEPSEVLWELMQLPSAQPEPCDDPRADIYYLAEKIGIHRLYELVVGLRGEPEPCEDAVSRQDVIDAARKVHDIFEGEYDTRTPYGVILDVQDAVIELPSVTPKTEQQWIPCSERLPEELTAVIITWKNHSPSRYYSEIKDKSLTGVGIYHKEKGWWWAAYVEDMLAEYGDSDGGAEVIAWMPLPEPYKEVKE